MNKLLSDYYNVREDHDILLGKLQNETQRIVNVLKKIFKCKKDTWWAFQYYENGNDESPLPSTTIIEDECFPMFISRECDSGIWSYDQGIPIKFFDMTDQKIEDYIKKEIQDFKEVEKYRFALEDAKNEKKLAAKNAIKESAIKKLTKEERKALGL